MSEAQIRPAEHQKLPASWLAPALHSVYLHAMINFAEAEVDGALNSNRNSDFRPGLHNYLQTHNLLKELHFPTEPITGFAFGLSVPPAAHGAMGHAAVTSPNVGEALATIAKYTPMRNNLIRYDWAESDETGTLSIEPRFDMGEYSEMILAATIATFVQMIAFLIGSKVGSNRIKGLAVELPWPVQHQPLSRTGPVSGVEFRHLSHQQRAAIVVPMQVLSHRNATRDAMQFRQACESCASELAQLQGSCAAEVKSYLQSMACSDWPILSVVADHLAMSRRTLIRKLEAEGTSFQALADEIKGNVACWQLENTSVPIGNLAFSLGFADESNFSRTFRRWRGMTPSQYRGIYSASESSKTKTSS